MDVRDAVEADADAMAAVAGAPADAMRTLVHDRTVRVAVADGGGPPGGGGRGPSDADHGARDAGRGPSEDAGQGARHAGQGAQDAGRGQSDVGQGQSEDAGQRARDVGDAADGTRGPDGPEPADLLGFVSYDAGRDAVHVTQLAGSPGALDRLLEEPVRFARAEGMPVELVVPAGEAATRDAAERAGFDATGRGPSFAGEETVTYRLEPA